MEKSKDKGTEQETKDQSQQAEASLQEIFEDFSRFGDRESDGETITLKNIDKWMKQANLLGGKKPISNADTAITFSKIAKTKKRVDINEFQKFLEQLAADKKMETKDLIEQLKAAGQPGMTNVTMPVSSGAAAANLERMTDTRLYTGAHKERFDEEGRGRGVEGREDRSDDSGYVTGYKDKGTYEKLKDDDEEQEDKDDK